MPCRRLVRGRPDPTGPRAIWPLHPYAVAFRYPGEDLDPSPPERNDITGWITEIDSAIGAAAAETA